MPQKIANLGRGHTNYDIQITVVILKNYYKIFSMTTLVYWNSYYDSFGVTYAQFELRGYCVFRFSEVDSIVNNDDVGLSEHLSR